MKYLILTLLTFLLISCEDSPTGTTGATEMTTPAIVTQPEDVQGVVDGDVTFSVTASGGSLSYQWYRDEVVISGAAASSYAVTTLSLDDNGSEFYVVVSNEKGSVTSESAALSVVAEITAPEITTQPVSISVTAGEEATFSVEATGVELSYQWFRDGSEVNGANSSTYTIASVSENDGGVQFYCEVSNSKGTIKTDVVTLTVKSETGEIPSHRSRMKLIPAGGVTFEMGIKDSIDYRDTKSIPVHNVTLTKSFYMDSTEVTVENYIEVMNWAYDNGYVDVLFELDTDDGAYPKGGGEKLLTLYSNKRTVAWKEEDSSFRKVSSLPNRPVDHVSWYGAAFYCNMLSIQDGLTPAYDISDWSCNFSADGYRLPTEAEWEFACRGGTTTAWHWGADSTGASKYAYYDNNSTTTVASKRPNEYGLYDMSGNAYEWCNDKFGDYTAESVIDPVGPAEFFDSFKDFVIRSRNTDALQLRSGYRSPKNIGDEELGFRVVLPE